MLSDATAEHTEVLEEFGEALGMAFQLSDDIMDITASQLELGKEPGQDMREGVYTAARAARPRTKVPTATELARACCSTARPTGSGSTGPWRSSGPAGRSSTPGRP